MAILAVNQIIDNIDSFINNIKKLSKSYYMFIARPNPWNDDAHAPAANASVEQTELSLYRDMVYGKLIFENDVSYMIRNIPWANNTIYAQYSQYDGNLIDKNFYVVNDVGEVYKCIYNNANSYSTIKPALNTPTGQFQTADGYIWKYMYTIDESANNKFGTVSYVPVTVNQNVESNAIPGTIDYITVTDPGVDYNVYEEGFLVNVADNGYDVFLSSNTSSPIEDYYTGSTIYLRAGGGAGQIREVASYRSDDRRLRVDKPFDVYVNLNLANVNGTIAVGDIITQNSVDISHFYDVGYFYKDDVVVQTDTGATGIIEAANASHYVLSKNNSSSPFTLSYPIYTTSSDGVIKLGSVSTTAGNNIALAVPAARSGTVDIVSGSNTITANTGTNFSTDYMAGDFIRVGEDPMVNSTMWTVKTGLVSVNISSTLVKAVGVLKSGGVDISSGSNTILANTGTNFTTDYSVGDFIRVGEDPMVNSSTWTLRAGYVSITAGSNTVTAVSGANLTADYVVGNFIRVGDITSNDQIRQITSVNSTVILVSNTFSQTYVSNVHYVVPSDQLSKITAVNSTVISVNSTFSQTYSNSVHYKLPRFTTDYSVGNFIQVGNTTSNVQIRAIASLNATAIVATTAFSQTYISNTHYFVPEDQLRRITAVTNTSISVSSAFSSNLTANVNYWMPRLTTDYSINSYIKVGNTTSNVQIRRVTSVNTTAIVVDSNTPFAQTYTANAHYSMSVASTPVSVQAINRTGRVTFTNLNGQNINISNTTPIGKLFLQGEKVIQVNINNVDQGANAIVSFANDSVVQLTSVAGTFTAGLYLLGQSSNVKSYIASAPIDFPNITLYQPNGQFSIGRTIFVSNSSGNSTFSNATIVSISTIPNQLTEYVISPKVSIQGDGNGVLAYAYVDTSGNNPSRQISEIRLINRGSNYTTANISITSNPQYGSNATAVASISPLTGHGSNTYIELGAKYAGISVTFSNGESESYNFPVYGKFRRVGILEDPTLNDAIIQLNSFDRVKLSLGLNNGTSFLKNEIAYQPNTGKAGIVVYSNASYLELKNVLDTGAGLPFYTYATNDSNTTIIGLTSGAQANVLTDNSKVSIFEVFSDIQSISEITSGATATIEQAISNTTIRLTNIKGHFNANDVIYDPVTNAYANVVTITTSNGRIDSTTNFGHKFNQTCRIPLTSNTGNYLQFETVVQQVSNAGGIVLSSNTDLDLELTVAPVSPYNTGDILTNVTTNTANAAIVLFANDTYIKCTAVSGTFSPEDQIENQLNVSANVTNVYPALVLYNVYNSFSTGQNPIVGQTSGASGLTTISNTIIYPDLVRNSGSVSYLENILPFERSNNSVEKINIVIKF